ncbi:SMC-Scp complex subunit ScpB [Planococcaceae bacterium Storch 2/2-2]|nr:SMC-Scp complex subunit ScpB [Planococcaceae bacterium Storch 2/2-2]
MEQKKGLIESLLFVVGEEGATIDEIGRLVDCSKEEVETLLEQMKATYDEREDRGIQLVRYGERVELVTKSEHFDRVEALLQKSERQSLTQASLEVLTIIAYKQPVTRVEIDHIRGVASDGPLQTVLAKHLVEERGRLEQPGRPRLYGTTETFLKTFGLVTLDDLPPLPTLEEVEGDEKDLFMSQFQEVFSKDS